MASILTYGPGAATGGLLQSLALGMLVAKYRHVLYR